MNDSRKPLVAGNWKMNGDAALVETFSQVFSDLDNANADVLICPPAVYLSRFSDAPFLVGGQNLSEHSSGAHTGELSASMLVENGCRYVLVGHSERRTDNGESNTLVAEKARQAISENLIPVVCVGEPEAIRESGEHFTYIASQLNAVFETLEIAQLAHIVVAYEPVWAIGTGKTASPEQAQEVHKFIRAHVAKQDADIASTLIILYGGSVKSSNAEALFSQSDVDGGLVGGASLDPQEFLKICQAAKG